MTPDTPRFADVMALRPVGPGEFRADLSEHWTIGPKIHGGVMVALCAKAAREAYAGPAAEPAMHPVAISVNFLSAPSPGPVSLRTTVRKRGRRIGLVDVELVQDQAALGGQERSDRGGVGGQERSCVHAVITLGDPEHQVPPLLSDSPITALMSVEPPPGVPAITPEDPGGEINNLIRGCDIHPQLSDPADGRSPVFRFWVRPKAGRVDELFALMSGDISLPLTYAVGRRGWAPTVQLTAYLRGMPTDGWLRVACTTTQIGQGWFDADHIVVDADGRVIVQTRQLALVPGASP
jgi:acyl-coenzyme A thioesterase PaaI-like protein